MSHFDFEPTSLPIDKAWLFDRVPIGFIILDQSGIILDINAAAVEMTGLNNQDSSGYFIYKILSNWITDIEFLQIKTGLSKSVIIQKRGKSIKYLLETTGQTFVSNGLNGYVLSIQKIKTSDLDTNPDRLYDKRLERIISDRTEQLSKMVIKLESEIHERQRIEEGLRDSESKFRTVIEQSSEAIILINSEGRILEINPAYEKLTGIRREDILGRLYWEVYFELIPSKKKASEEKQKIQDIILDALRQESSPFLNQELEAEIRHFDGSIRNVLQTIFLINTENGNRLGVITRDITKQKLVEIESQKNSQNLFELNTLSSKLADASTIDDLNQIIAERIQILTGAVACIITNYHQTDKSLSVEYISSSNNTLFQANKLLKNSIKKLHITMPDEKKSMLLSQGFTTRDSLTELTFGSIPEMVGNLLKETFKLGEIVVIPIDLAGELFGTISIYLPDNAAKPPIDLIRTISRVITVAIQRKRAEQELIVSEERFRSMLENTNDMICILDRSGCRKFIANPNAYKRVLGYNLDQLLGREVFEIVHPDDQELVRTKFSEITNGNLLQNGFEFRSKRADGSWIYLDVDIQNLLYNPSIDGLLVTARDVTYKRQTEEALRQSEEQFHRMFERHHAIMLLVSPETGMIVDANDAARIFYGYSIDELKMMHINKINQLPQSKINSIIQDIKTDVPIKYVFPHKLISGEIKTVEVLSSLIDLPSGQVLFSIVQDVSDRIVAEEEKEKAIVRLRESEDKMQSIFRVAPTGIGVVNNRVLVYVNPKICEMVGYSQDELIGQSARILYPTQEEFDFVGREKYKQIAEKDSGVVETIWKCKDGSFINIILASTPIDLKDLSKGVTFTALDITDRKNSEKALQESEEKFRKIFEASKIGISTIDQNGRFTSCNPSLLYMLGYDLDEFTKLTFRDISHPDDFQINQQLHQELLDGKRDYFTIEKRNRHKDGHFVWGQLTSVLVRDSNQKLIYVMGMFEDISQRKEAEVALHEQEKFIRTVIDKVPVGIFVVNKEGIINYLNPAGQDIWQGVHYVDVDGLSDYQGWRLSDGSKVEAHEWGSAKALKGQTTLDEEIEIEAFDGTRKIISNSGIPIYDDNGEINGAVAILQNITERKKTEKALIQSSDDLIEAYNATLQGWSHALELREHETAGHSQRVVDLTIQMAHRFGYKDDDIRHVQRGALLHDIGKMGIPDSILLKPGPLSDEEWIVMKKHPVFAKQLLSNIPYLAPALEIPYYHHERWDGTGYPMGLKGKSIPLSARIFAVVDVWDALSSDRPYRKGWPETKIIKYLKDKSGELLDPEIVKEFLKLLGI